MKNNLCRTYGVRLPSLASINTVLGNFADLIQTAASRDKVQVELKRQVRFSLLQMLSQLADMVNATTQDPALLIRSGFDLNKMPTPVELEAPTRLVLLDGPNAGELLTRLRTYQGRYLLRAHGSGGQQSTAYKKYCCKPCFAIIINKYGLIKKEITFGGFFCDAGDVGGYGFF